MSISHLCDKYSASASFKLIKADLGNLRAHLETLSVIIIFFFFNKDDFMCEQYFLNIILLL